MRPLSLLDLLVVAAVIILLVAVGSQDFARLATREQTAPTPAHGAK